MKGDVTETRVEKKIIIQGDADINKDEVRKHPKCLKELALLGVWSKAPIVRIEICYFVFILFFLFFFQMNPSFQKYSCDVISDHLIEPDFANITNN